MPARSSTRRFLRRIRKFAYHETRAFFIRAGSDAPIIALFVIVYQLAFVYWCTRLLEGESWRDLLPHLGSILGWGSGPLLALMASVFAWNAMKAPTLSFTETPSAPGGMVLYRVTSLAGAAYLPPNNLAKSSPSNTDFANVNSGTYEPLGIDPNFTAVKAQHLIELRQAVNALCDAVGIAQEYQAADMQLSALQGQIVYATDFTSLMTHINNVRTNAACWQCGSAAFGETPATSLTIKAQHLQELRDALK